MTELNRPFEEREREMKMKEEAEKEKRMSISFYQIYKIEELSSFLEASKNNKKYIKQTFEKINQLEQNYNKKDTNKEYKYNII